MARACARTVLILLGLTLVLASCQAVSKLAREYDPRQLPEQRVYEEAIAPYLAKASVRQGPATELLVTALPLTPTVRRAMASREAAARGWKQPRAESRLAEMEANAASGLEVIICSYAPEKARADLWASWPDWTLTLNEADGRVVSTGDVRLIKSRDALREALYPFWGPWDRLHRLRFPGLAPNLDEAILIISGAPGRTALKLKLD